MICSARRFTGIVVILVLSGLALAACASSRAPGPAFEVAGDADRDRLACESALLRLERLILQRSSEDRFSAAALLEATELQQLGQELYLEGEYALALEMIEEGIQLLEEKSD
jgi:hypothetical protein